MAYKVAASLDTTAPQVEVLSPANGSTVNFADSSHLVTVTGVVTENVAIQSVLVDGELAALSGASWTATILLENGANIIQVVAVDQAGNVGLASLHTLVGQPSYGIQLAAAPTSAKVGEEIAYTAVVTATDLLTGTVLFPFSGQGLQALTGTATTGTVVLTDTTVSWAGVVRPEAPVTITWVGRPTEAGTRTIYALVQGDQMLPRSSNEVDLNIDPLEVRLFLPLVRKNSGE